LMLLKSIRKVLKIRNDIVMTPTVMAFMKRFRLMLSTALAMNRCALEIVMPFL